MSQRVAYSMNASLYSSESVVPAASCRSITAWTSSGNSALRPRVVRPNSGMLEQELARTNPISPRGLLSNTYWSASHPPQECPSSTKDLRPRVVSTASSSSTNVPREPGSSVEGDEHGGSAPPPSSPTSPTRAREPSSPSAYDATPGRSRPPETLALRTSSERQVGNVWRRNDVRRDHVERSSRWQTKAIS